MSTGRLQVTLAEGSYVLDKWLRVGLRDLGMVNALAFSVDASQRNLRGEMNVPAYFALDDLSFVPTPVPPAAALLAVPLVWLLGRRRRGRAGRA